MKTEQIVPFLKLLGATLSKEQDRAEWVLSDCPLQPWRHTGGKSSPKVFGIRKEGGDSFCHCFSCGFKGTQGDLVLEMQLLNRKDPQNKFDFPKALDLIAEAEDGMELEIDLSSPDVDEVLFGGKNELYTYPDWWLDSFDSAFNQPWAMQYLKARKVPDVIIAEYDLRADTKQRRVCFPVRDFDGALRGLHGRAVDGEDPLRYRMYTHAKQNNPIVWFGEQSVDFDLPIIIVEGVFDAASVRRVYANVVSPLFAGPSFEKLKRLADGSEYITLLDWGMAGDNGRSRISKAYSHATVTHLKSPEEGMDAGDMTIAQLQELLEDHVELLQKPIA